MRWIVWMILMAFSVSISAQDFEDFISRQMGTYPQSRLLDIYKSCFQDYMGAEHLVSNRESVKAYLDDELSTVTLDNLLPWDYEPCGINGNYYRVSLRLVKDGVITEDQLIDTFVRSATDCKRPAVEQWRDEWQRMMSKIDQMNLSLPFYQEDKLFIDSILAAGKYAISHSPEYRDAYHPHYRIVRRDIFENEIMPVINKNKMMEMKAEDDIGAHK